MIYATSDLHGYPLSCYEQGCPARLPEKPEEMTAESVLARAFH